MSLVTTMKQHILEGKEVKIPLNRKKKLRKPNCYLSFRSYDVLDTCTQFISNKNNLYYIKMCIAYIIYVIHINYFYISILIKLNIYTHSNNKKSFDSGKCKAYYYRSTIRYRPINGKCRTPSGGLTKKIDCYIKVVFWL